MKVLSYPGNVRAHRILIVGKYIGIDIDYPTDFNFADTRSAEFLQHCPMHQVRKVSEASFEG
jgi:hypothetical protein